MDIAGSLRLSSLFARAVAQMGLDRVGEISGHALPRTPAQLCEPAVVDDLLRESPTPATLPPVRSVRLPGIEFESSNCQNFLIEVEFETDRGTQEALPKTLYAKLPSSSFGTRAFANAVGFWEVEATFCERIAQRVPIRVPKVFAVAMRGSRFVLLLENLHEIPGAKLFLNRDMSAGTTVARAQMCLETFAELHAEFWGYNEAQQEELLPLRLHPYLAPGGRETTRALNASAIDGAHKAAPDVFTESHVALCRRAIQKWDALVDAWYAAPLTLIHGDSHLANCFEYPTPDGPRIGMLDFQGLQWCAGIRDVQYFLINSLEPELLAQSENDLIRGYVAALAQRGIDYEFSQAQSLYRGFAFQTLMVAVITIGLGTLTERDETVRTVLRRSVAAIDRLDFAGWLETV